MWRGEAGAHTHRHTHTNLKPILNLSPELLLKFSKKKNWLQRISQDAVFLSKRQFSD